ncbi:hypothetical protein [Candidatus Viadribacter manganicus]|uniref:hypothetical protein n=1 Tax=Candidatus Viadribacter manganicus TaxID=1759059 RepID=UPI0012EA5E71|nr:hypothetical protein [Candidatus Viadribacter manganicus]
MRGLFLFNALFAAIIIGWIAAADSVPINTVGEAVSYYGPWLLIPGVFLLLAVMWKRKA